MSRYIDVDELHEEDLEQSIWHLLKSAAGLVRLKEILGDTPTEDVVGVVRCKDCRYYVAQYCTRDIKGRTNMFYMCADDFCSYGERKEENA